MGAWRGGGGLRIWGGSEGCGGGLRSWGGLRIWGGISGFGGGLRDQFWGGEVQGLWRGVRILRGGFPGFGVLRLLGGGLHAEEEEEVRPKVGGHSTSLPTYPGRPPGAGEGLGGGGREQSVTEGGG